MKKSLIIIFLLNISLVWSANAQEPTKQETMDWIISKFKTYGGGRIDNGSFRCKISNSLNIGSKICFFIKEETSNDRYANEPYSDSRCLDLNNVLEVVDEMAGYDNFIQLKDPNVSTKSYAEKGENTFLILSESDSWITYFMSFDAEPNLKERMVKALKTLAKHNNSERPKEKF